MFHIPAHKQGPGIDRRPEAPTVENLGRELAVLQKQLSQIRLHSLRRRCCFDRAALDQAVQATIDVVKAVPYNHHAASAALDTAEALLDRYLGDAV